MGVADIIPGISGGTIALITGIYERLIQSINNIDFKFVPYSLKGDFRKARKNFIDIDFKLFIPLLFGIGLAFLLMANAIHYLLNNYVALTYAFFFGLILSSAAIIYKQVDGLSVKNILSLLIGFLLAFLFVGIGALQIGHSLPIIFLSGIIAICAMILPGISGSFLLLLLNQYEHMLFVLKSLQLPEIFTFCSGAFVGILCFSRILNYLLDKHKALTFSFLIGLMLGALRLPYQQIVATEFNFLILIPAILGFSIGFILESKSKKIN
ncbi:MAG: DUF368 domain-containing protein [Candidatus Aenigmarchaeota archaeon]|nr:DUF368 domain-containing protein [Candidatus Aenigmarchaeota archaeon]